MSIVFRDFDFPKGAPACDPQSLAHSPETRSSQDARYDPAAHLRRHGLRPTRQRVALAGLLFAGPGRHVTAERLHAETTRLGLKISQATIYNTLHQFLEAGLLRQIGVDGSRSFFDTNPGRHHHFFIASENRLFDAPAGEVELSHSPEPLPGHEVIGVDIIIHLRRKTA